MLTARASEIDVVMGLDAGADDYVVKPFRPAELLARIRAHLRRATTDDAAGPYAVGALTLDLDERRASWDGVELVLRPKEFDLLHALVRQAGHAVTREALMADVWDPNWFGSTKTLDVHVSSLRRKIADAGGTLALTTLRGVGFRLERS
jgi:DNA-binding response OmpR family regulator